MGTATQSSTPILRGGIEACGPRSITRVSNNDNRFWVSPTEGPRHFVRFTTTIAGLERIIWVEQNAVDRAYAFVEVTIEAVLTNKKVMIYRLVSLSAHRRDMILSDDPVKREDTMIAICECLGMIRRP